MCSRTNPFTKKPRFTRKGVLIIGEGPCDEIFLRHLKNQYDDRDSGVTVTIGGGVGGTPHEVVLKAINRPGSFSKKVVVIDNDKSNAEMSTARIEAGKHDIDLFEHTPCLEAVLLSLLNKGKSFAHESSPWCKHEFESKHIEKKRRRIIQEYEKIFSKSFLDLRRTSSPELNRIISIIEGKW